MTLMRENRRKPNTTTIVNSTIVFSCILYIFATISMPCFIAIVPSCINTILHMPITIRYSPCILQHLKSQQAIF